MKKEVKIAIIVAIVMLLSVVVYFVYGGLQASKTPVVVEVATCSQDQYDAMVTNAPDKGCATEWAVVCGEGATWKYQCFGGQVEEVSEQTLRDELDAAQKAFYELCEQNPELVCG